MNIKVIVRNVGLALLVSSLFMFISMLLSLAEGNDSALAAMTISFVLTFIVGIFPFIFVKREKSISLQDGYMIIFLAWILSFIFGTLPYLLWGGPFSVVNAWFESVSGFTTTGATILDNPESLPDSLLFWRASTHFIGGLGVVVFLLLVIPSSGPVKLRLTNMEVSSLSKDAYQSRTNKTVTIFALVYLGLNALAFLLYLLAGMSPLDAICQAFSVCATGGFSTRNESIASFGSPAVVMITMVFMYLASVHFGLIWYSVITRSLKPLYRNPVLQFYTGMLVAATLLVSFSLRISGTETTLGKAMLDGGFQVLSYASTTGFAITDNSAWPLFPTAVLLIVGIICGCAGSTSGGIKSDRVLVLFKATQRLIHNTIHPSSVEEIKIGRRSVKDEEVYPHVLFVTLFFMLLIISILLCFLFGEHSANALYGAVASISNVGASVGPTIGSMGNFGREPEAVKFIFTVNMFLGRLEIYPVLAIFSLIMHPKRRQ
jgi:trk system potassium uptake protein TrkH